MKASLTWGFSFSKTDTYKQTALRLNLQNNPQWLKLGHYEKTLFNKFESPFKVGLFLASDGATNPQTELLATIEALYNESTDLTTKLKYHPQCYYLARTKWLNKILNVADEDRLPCEERQIWKKNLNVKSVAIIFAASDLGNASSSFGHTFLKFINPQNAKNRDLIDYGIDYSADADSSEGFLYALKGLSGFYSGRYTLLPYHQKIREYLNADGRDIWEYHLNFTETEVDFLIDHILEMEKARAPYYFFNDNCSFQILKTLEVAKPNIDLSASFKYFVIPIDTVKKVIRQTDWIKETKYKKSLKADYLESVEQLKPEQKDILKQTIQLLKIPESAAINNKDQAEVLEAAQKYYAIQSFKTGKDLDQEKYALSSERAILGLQDTNIANTKPSPPHSSHDSSAIYFSTIKNYPNLKQNDFYQLKFRHALHDLEQEDSGTVPFSHNEMMSISLNYLPENKSIEFANLTLLKLYNLNPSNFLDNNFSWKIDLNISKNWNYDNEASAGSSFDFSLQKKMRFVFFITGHSWKIEDKYFNALGPEFISIYRLQKDLGVSYSLSYFGIKSYNDFLRHKFKLNYRLYDQFDLQASYEQGLLANQVTTVSLLYNFLF